MSHEKAPVIDQQLENQFNTVAKNANQADRLSPSDPKHLHHERQFYAGSHHESVGDPAVGPYVSVDRPRSSGHIQRIDASVSKYTDLHNSVRASATIDNGNKFSSTPELNHASLRVKRNGEVKELTSDNPLVARMISQIALKGANERAINKKERAQNETDLARSA